MTDSEPVDAVPSPPLGTQNETEMLSPNAMAKAVFDSAIAERERASEAAANNGINGNADASQSTTEGTLVGTQDSNNRSEEFSSDKDVKEKLKQVWEGSNDKDAAVQETMTLVHKEIETLIRAGLEAYHGWESANRDLVHAKEECEAKDRELRRLRASEEQSRATITNLLKTVESSKSDARDASRAVQMEARLRADLAHLRTEHNEVLAQAAEHKRKAELLEEDLRGTKSKYAKIVQEKAKIVRDSRTAISLARSLDTHASSDCDFYKRKANELTNSLQTQQALVAEQKHQIEEMRRQIERTMSQNRLATIRAEGGRKRGH